jgi:hypothetical protein
MNPKTSTQVIETKASPMQKKSLSAVVINVVSTFRAKSQRTPRISFFFLAFFATWRETL